MLIVLSCSLFSLLKYVIYIVYLYFNLLHYIGANTKRETTIKNDE